MQLGQEAEAALDGLFQRTRDGEMHDLARKSLDKRIDRALAAVRQRKDLHIGLGKHFACRLRCRLARRKRGKTSLERINRHDDFHDFPSHFI